MSWVHRRETETGYEYLQQDGTWGSFDTARVFYGDPDGTAVEGEPVGVYQEAQRLRRVTT